jgi:hypothetical protein
MGNSEQGLESPAGYTLANPQDIYNLKAERGPSAYDVKLMNVTSILYQLPFGKGRQFGASWGAPLDAILGGWALNTIHTMNTGLPLNIIYTPSAALDGTGRLADYRGVASQRPNVVADTTRPSGVSMNDQYWNKAAFVLPTASAPYGNLGRNAMRGPNFWQWDLGVNKSFKIPAREGMALQFRSEFFNFLNHTNFGTPDCSVSSASFATIKSTYPPRQIQFALKLTF